jgi:methyltransferase-like protein 22
MIGEVSSDLYLELPLSKILASEIITSRYEISLPKVMTSASSSPVQRIKKKKRLYGEYCYLTIQHRVSTSIDRVGEQLWRGSFILSDYLFFRRNDLHDYVAFELGGGVGFLSIVASLIPFKSVYYTDYSQDIVNLGSSNLENNSHLSTVDNTLDRCPTYPRVLDWFQEISRSHASDANGWGDKNQSQLDSNDILWLAADVVYDDKITEAFFKTLSRLMRNSERLWLSIEKRFNFTVDEMSLVAHGYNRFLSYVEGSNACVYFDTADQIEKMRYFSGHRIPLLFPQYVEYDRTKDIELWEIIPIDESKHPIPPRLVAENNVLRKI